MWATMSDSVSVRTVRNKKMYLISKQNELHKNNKKNQNNEWEWDLFIANIE